MKYKLYRPTPIELAQAAARLAGLTGDALDAERKHAAAIALPAKYRTRNKLTDPEWPAPGDLATWHAIGAHDALAFTPPRVTISDHPSALAYYAGYTPTLGAFLMPDQVSAPENPIRSLVATTANELELDEATLGLHLARGDVSNMSDRQKSNVLVALAHSIGANPLCKPFMIVDGSIYPTATCASFIRKKGGLECDAESFEPFELLGEFMIKCVAVCRDPKTGRTERAHSFVPQLVEKVTEWGESNSGKKYPLKKELVQPTAEELCDKLMKAETKAVRRATLKFDGMGTSAAEDVPASTANSRMWVEQVEEPATDETQATPTEPEP